MAALSNSLFLPIIDQNTMQTGNIIFIIFGTVCVLMGLLVLLLNRKKNKTQKYIGVGFFIVGLLSLFNNGLQYLFWK